MNYSDEFLQQVKYSMECIDPYIIEEMVCVIKSIQENGRLFIIGNGGGAGHASHACADFRKLCCIDTLCFENVSEITARTNDDGFDMAIVEWLKASKINEHDCLFVISVGGGTDDVSKNISNAVLYCANIIQCKILGIISGIGSYTDKYSNVRIMIHADKNTTPIVEGLQSVILHGIATNPQLKKNNCVW
jgi:D-sedoheptulose 7-phosphate isomerase